LKGLEGTLMEGNALYAKVRTAEGRCVQIQGEYRKMKRENERLELIIYTCFKNNAKNDQWIGGLEQALRNISAFNLIESQITQRCEAENKLALRARLDMRKARLEKRTIQAKTLDKVAEQLLAKIQLKEAYLNYENVINSASAAHTVVERSVLPATSVRSQSPRVAERLEAAFQELGAALRIADPVEGLEEVLGVLERGRELEMQVHTIKEKVERLERVKAQLQAQWTVLKATQPGFQDVYIDTERISTLQKQLKDKTKRLEATADSSAEAEERLARVLQCLQVTAQALALPSTPLSFQPVQDRLVQMMSVLPQEEQAGTLVSRASAVLVTQQEEGEEESRVEQVWARSKHMQTLKALLQASQDEQV